MIRVDPASPTPLYAQLERAIRAEIAAGRMAVGDQLPTVRQLAVDLRINANTVARVYAGLERDGVVATRRGVGTFICDVNTPPAPARDRERELRLMVDTLLADAGAIGITYPEVLRHLEARRARETR
ncbi:MAG: ytrA 1 [Gemmatimonadetes bacterium]|nr:ytrA 1 [Gemmatimonadota bacterium]